MSEPNKADEAWPIACVGATTLEPDDSKRSVRFSLRELFALTGLVAVGSACYSWLAAAPLLAGFTLFLTVFATIAYAIHLVTRWSVVGVLCATMVLSGVCALFVPPGYGSPGSSRRARCQNNMHNITLALLQYHELNGSFPPAYIADDQGRPMHSWRVLLLPYLDQRNLYKEYRFDEPWDGPNNSRLHNLVLKIYSCPSQSQNALRTDTSYAVVVGSQTMWPGEKAIKLSDIKDGTANTIMLVEVHNSGIHWMEPRDLHVTQMPMAINPPSGQGISSGHVHGADVGFADGSVRFVTDKTSAANLRAALSRSGGENVDLK